APDNYESYLRAAEEAGISREAMWQALSERFLVPMETLKVGEIVFARGADEVLYVATVQEIAGPTSLVVEFMKGGQQRVALSDIRALGLIPGRQVQFEYDVVVPGIQNVWHTGKVVAYDAATQEATIAEGIGSYQVPLSKLRLKVEAPRVPLRVRD